jgi:hypothetical protein
LGRSIGPFEIARSDDFSETQFLQEAKILAGGVASRRGVDVPGYTPATAESQPGSASPSLFLAGLQLLEVAAVVFFFKGRQVASRLSLFEREPK